MHVRETEETRALVYAADQARSSEIVIGTAGHKDATRISEAYYYNAQSTPARGVWGHAPPGKFWISGLLRSFLVQFRGKIAGVGRPAASRSATSYLDLLASYQPGYEANVRGYPRSQASQTSFGTQGAMARARICDCRSSAESSLKRKTKGTVNIGPAMAVLVE